MKKITSEKKTIYSAIAVVFLLVGWYGYTCIGHKVCKSALVEGLVRHDKEIIAPQGTIEVEVVDTSRSRALGLSGRKGLGDDEGMLFVFEAPGRYGFWMKDMLFPLDIIWINQNGVVVHIERNATPESYTDNPDKPQTFINTPDALYVLEVKAGKAETYGLYLGTKVTIEE